MLKSLIALFKGHLTILKHIFKKPVTLEYPEIKPSLNENFRGRHVFDDKKCGGCENCLKVCPTGAIKIVKDKDDNDKTYVKEYFIDLGKCIFCGNCAYYCPTKAISMGKEFELATDNKQNLILKLKSLGDIINE